MSGHFADTLGLAGSEPNLTKSKKSVAWSVTENPCGAKAGYGPNQHAHNDLNILAEQHVYWQEQGRHALNFQQAGLERAAQEYEHTARDEVHVAVAQATEIFRAEMREIMGVFENQAEQTWTSHQVTLLNEMKSRRRRTWKTRE